MWKDNIGSKILSFIKYYVLTEIFYSYSSDIPFSLIPFIETHFLIEKNWMMRTEIEYRQKLLERINYEKSQKIFQKEAIEIIQ